MKIKYQPEDFIVQEKAALNLQTSGAYSVYQLTKRGWNTVDALRQLAKLTKLPYNDFAYGGKKDRYGLTTQYITVHGRKIDVVSADGLALKFCGFSDRQMGPDLIVGNEFNITVRSLAAGQAQQALSEAEEVKRSGFVNYFDDQRFGSFDERQGFLAERILKKQFNGAVKTYLTSIHPQDSSNEKKRRQFFSEHWKEWAVCSAAAGTAFEKEAFGHLIKNSTDFLSILELIPREELSLYFSAYQSFLWNELVRRLIKETVLSPCWIAKGAAGEYVFPKAMSTDEANYLAALIVPTASAKAKMPDEFVAKIYKEILTEREIEVNMFNKVKTRQAFFKSTERAVMLSPSGLVAEIQDDELFSKKKKVCLEFLLPRGSYATMLIKRLFARDTGHVQKG